jgi:catechol 2,3-dioxygenase-like lactoylglutathione lyase family enzyme
MRKPKGTSSWLSRSLGVGIAVCALAAAMASVRLPKVAADQGNPQVLGMAFDGHSVSNLENSIKFYKVLDFKVVKKPTGWKVDKTLNKLEGLPADTQSRTAVLATQSSVSDTPFDLILHQYKGVDQKNWSKLDSGALGAGHMDLTVMDDCNIVINKLKAAGLLVLPNMGAFSRAPAHGPRPFVFVQDPDGWYIELFAIINPKPGVRVDAGKLSNSSATMANMNRLGYQTGFNHIGLNVSDAAKERSFYEDVLGGDYPPIPPAGASGLGRGMTMLNGWFPQAQTDGTVRLEILGAAANAGKPGPGEKLSDINVNYVGFEVSDINAVYAKAKAAGATDVTDGGIITVKHGAKDGRAVMMLDPNGLGYVELWQSSKAVSPQGN